MAHANRKDHCKRIGRKNFAGKSKIKGKKRGASEKTLTKKVPLSKKEFSDRKRKHLLSRGVEERWGKGGL